MKSLRDEIFANCKDEIRPQSGEREAIIMQGLRLDDMQSICFDYIHLLLQVMICKPFGLIC